MKGSNSHTFSEGSSSAGHPSLNAWVLDRVGLGTNRLDPIEELASTYLTAMLEFNLSNLSYERNYAVLCGTIRRVKVEADSSSNM